MPDRDDSSTRSWEAVAEDWVAHADQNDYRNDFLMPLTLELLGGGCPTRVRPNAETAP
jgi:hypothetical protein